MKLLKNYDTIIYGVLYPKIGNKNEEERFFSNQK